MGTLSNPKTLVPDMNTKDCSQGFCTLYCPQWCYLMFPPPPPPFAFPQPERDSSSFSPLVIAIIGILASAFLLLSYYVIISKYCSRCMTQDQGQNHYFSEEFDEDHEDPSNYEEQWGVSNDGLDDFLIKSITICKYKKGDGLVDFNDCPVCLGEFEENDALRLLPKCNHAFHVSCIDTWLKSNSNCPLCRANIVSNSTLSHPSSASPRDLGSSQQTPNENDQVWNVQIGNETECPEGIPKSPVRGLRDTVIENDQLWTTQTSTETEESESIPQIPAQGLRDTIIEISDDNENMVRRSFSMDHPRGNNISIGDTSNGASSSRSRVLHSVMKSISMKRSLSSGRLFFIKDGRARNAVIPV